MVRTVSQGGELAQSAISLQVQQNAGQVAAPALRRGPRWLASWSASASARSPSRARTGAWAKPRADRSVGGAEYALERCKRGLEHLLGLDVFALVREYGSQHCSASPDVPPRARFRTASTSGSRRMASASESVYMRWHTSEIARFKLFKFALVSVRVSATPSTRFCASSTSRRIRVASVGGFTLTTEGGTQITSRSCQHARMLRRPDQAHEHLIQLPEHWFRLRILTLAQGGLGQTVLRLEPLGALRRLTGQRPETAPPPPAPSASHP